MANVLRPTSVPTPFPWPGNLIGGIMIVALTASFFYVKPRAAKEGGPTLDFGLGLLIINALAIAVINEWVPTFPDTRYVSWNTILILVYAMVVPTTPLKMFAACLVAASMDPLAVGIANLRGLTAPSFAKAILLYYPNYLCAVIAVLPSIALHRMGRRITNARELGSYELVEQLGQGGMGEVWRAEHRLLVRPAAIKLVRPEMLGLASEQDAGVLLRRFEREAQATAVLSSPHTIDLFDFGLTDDGAFYYVMELLIGRDLQSLVRDFGALPADRVTYLLRQVCHSLAEAHARGLVHRDIKPANVYVCRMGLDYDFVKVLDFGLVRFSTPGARSTLLSGRSGDVGHSRLHGARSDPGRGGSRSARGCLFDRVPRLLDAHRPARVRGRLADEDADESRRDSARAAVAANRAADSSANWIGSSSRVSKRIPTGVLRMPKCCGRCCSSARAAETWSRVAARRWWEVHLPELTQPLVLAVPAAGASLRRIARRLRSKGRTLLQPDEAPASSRRTRPRRRHRWLRCGSSRRASRTDARGGSSPCGR